jgi:hypothetical protein
MRCVPRPLLGFLEAGGTVSPSYRRRKKSKRCRRLTLSWLPFGGAQTEYHADRIRPLLYAYNDLLAASGWED